MTKDVVFAPVDGPLNDRIDEAYRRKYGRNPYLGSMISAPGALGHREDLPADRRDCLGRFWTCRIIG